MPAPGTDVSVVVAVVDEGVDVLHEDLKTLLSTHMMRLTTMTTSSHYPQTVMEPHVPGSLEQLQTTTSVTGVAPGIRIMPIRIATGNSIGGWDTDNRIIAKGFEVAVDCGANVLRNRVGGGAPSSLINDAIDYGTERGRVFVFAAGRVSSSLATRHSLSATRPIIAVSATNEWDEFQQPYFPRR